MSFRESTTTVMDISQTLMGQEQQSSQSNEMVVFTEVLTVDEHGVARVRTTYESIRIVQDGPMGRTEYDSADPESVAPQALRPYALMIGESFTMDFAPDGSIDGVEGMEDLFPRMIEEMDLPVGAMRDEVEKTLEDQFGGEAVAGMMGKMKTGFPDEPVAVGESWTRSTQVEKPMPLDVEMTWTLRERRGGVAYLDVTSVTIIDGTTELGSSVMEQHMSGEATGTVEIDEATGLTLRSHTEDETSGTMTLSGGPMGDMVMPMTSRSVTTTELLSRN